jgi:dipeptidyl aminopeptidase/acylaminoacyl peptidase
MTRSTVAVALALAALAAAPLAAQNHRERPSRGFVAETQAMQARWRDAVRNERVDPEWLDDRRVIVRLDEPGGGWRYMVCDAEDGAVEPAFDHVLVAEQLAERLGRTVTATALPFARFARDGDGLVAMLGPDVVTSAESPVVRLSATGVSDAAALPEAFRARAVRDRASGSGPATYLLVRNPTGAAVRLFWLDGSGEARGYETIAPGTSGVRTTFAGHVWSLRAGERELARVIGEPRPSVVDLGMAAEEEASPRREPAARGEPAARRVVVRDHDVVRLDGDVERPLTTDGTAEFGFGGRVWISPERTHAVVMKTRRVPRRTIHFVESSPSDQVQPRLHEMTYVKPGDPRDEPTPWVFDLDAGTGQAVDAALIPSPWSLTEVHWRDADRFRLLYNQRGHAVVRLIEFDAATGAGRTVVEEASDTFVDYPNKIMHRRLADGRILWMSQRTGWNHLYLLDGETGDVIRPLTAGEWLVRSVESVDEDAGTVLLRVLGIHPGQDPYHHHFVRVAIDTGDMTILTDGDGTHEIERAPGGEHYIARYQRVDLPPVTELRRWTDGTRVAELAAADASELLARGWPAPERFVAKGRDGTTDIWGVIFRPTDFDPAKRYPVIENIYAGPHGHFVPKTWSTWHGHRELAERGFIVVQIDGMGTNWRSKAFHDVAHRNLGDSGFPDRIAWLRAAAATRPWMDLERVGIHGGSAGGQSAVRALIAHGDFYDAAVADCGCHDNRVDKMWWNELWMGYPIGPHYAEQSNVTQAGRIEGDLLLIVGEMDRNVDPASTMQVVDALIKADKDFELLVIPGAGHGAAGSPYGRRRQAEFFRRTLGGPEAAEG